MNKPLELISSNQDKTAYAHDETGIDAAVALSANDLIMLIASLSQRHHGVSFVVWSTNYLTATMLTTCVSIVKR